MSGYTFERRGNDLIVTMTGFFGRLSPAATAAKLSVAETLEPFVYGTRHVHMSKRLTGMCRRMLDIMERDAGAFLPPGTIAQVTSTPMDRVGELVIEANGKLSDVGLCIAPVGRLGFRMEELK